MRKLIGVLVFSFGLLGFVPVSVAQPSAISKNCEYEGGNGTYCTGWQPSRQTCYRIFERPNAKDWQKRKCLAYGWGK